MTEIRHLMRSVPLFRAVLAIGGSLFAAWTACGAAQPPRSRVEPVAAIRAAAAAFVRSQLPAKEVARIHAGSLDNRLRLARCATTLRVETLAGTESMANSTISVSCTRPVHWRVFVPVTVVRRVPVLILRHAVAGGSHLTAADVRVKVREINGFSAPFLGSASQLLGRSTDRTLPAGTSLTADMFTVDPVIDRGQDVTLVAQADGLIVRAAGRALDDAHRGQRLRVENLSSHKVVQGVAESSRIVEVGD